MNKKKKGKFYKSFLDKKKVKNGGKVIILLKNDNMIYDDKKHEIKVIKI